MFIYKLQKSPIAESSAHRPPLTSFPPLKNPGYAIGWISKCGIRRTLVYAGNFAMRYCVIILWHRWENSVGCLAQSAQSLWDISSLV